jgi:glycosyltransferase involved in cell wall biosynthesis
MNKNNQTRFTVIIPTKNRAEYLKYTIKTCSEQSYENLEILVSDDGSTDDTKEIVLQAANRDNRIKYITPGNTVGMWANFEYSLSQVKPGYVIALGGDDGLLPDGICNMHDVLQDTGTNLLAWPTPTFIYPNVRMDKAQLIIPAKNGQIEKGVEIIQSKEFLERQSIKLKYVTDEKSPMFYVKGVASTELILRVKNRTKGGCFYACSTPDGYSGIVLAGEVEKYAFSKTPFSIHGASPSSQGVAFLSKKPEMMQQAEDFYSLAKSRPMHVNLASQPYSPLIALMTADYLLTARDLPGWGGTFPEIDYRKMVDISLDELLNAQWAEERIKRELGILMKIAEYHKFGDYLKNKIKVSKRNMWKPLEGNAISPSKIFIDCSVNNIKNIVNASFAAYGIHQIMPELNYRNVCKALFNSMSHRLNFIKKGSRICDQLYK